MEDREPYEFTHYLIMSKTYNEVASNLPTEDQPPSKKKKGGKGDGGEAEMFYFLALILGVNDEAGTLG